LINSRDCTSSQALAEAYYHKNYSQAFVDAVRDRTPSIGPIQDAVRSDAIRHLSAIAIQSGEEVVWNPKAYQIL
jgi:hypothetical protein